jgi:ferric-dicitrate binding protein FerR (iron transport regulator)
MLAFLDGRFGPAEARKFEELLRRDRAARKELLVLAGFEAELPAALKEAETAAPDMSGPPVAGARARGAARFAVRALLPLAAAAGLVLAVRAVLPGPRAGAGSAHTAAVQRPVEGQLVEVSGEVLVGEAGANGRLAAAASGTVVRAGSAISLGAGASAVFVCSDGSVLRLYRNTAVVLERTKTGANVQLLRGAVDAVVLPQPPGSMFVAHTGLMRADIVGTEFRLMADSKSAWLGVRKGAVIVTRAADGQKLNIDDGKYAAVASDWPFMRMNTLVCPRWQSVCRQAAGSLYP